ncbi:hypothetical protein FOZ61_002394 [Perkinsus olseni]|uniref:Uncharacterized protein n=1 Tax=Perkinsus olseni TaxID=32597 RepID=A0A7J6KNB0_PEROL|nr:hypothetical protein FOZ61_002394 [Perkinsus olseni]
MGFRNKSTAVMWEPAGVISKNPHRRYTGGERMLRRLIQSTSGYSGTVGIPSTFACTEHHRLCKQKRTSRSVLEHPPGFYGQLQQLTIVFRAHETSDCGDWEKGTVMAHLNRACVTCLC